MKILFTGGGTGGHIFPIIAIVREIKKLKPENIELLYVGPNNEDADMLLSQEGIEVKIILAGKIRRYINPKAIILNIIDIFKLFLGIFQAFFWLFVENPDLVFCKGGYGSVPVVISAKILQIPIFSHESDIVPGIANRFSAKSSLEVFTSFPKTQYLNPKKIILTGNPIRKELLSGSKEKSKEILKLTREKPILFIYPGSQGAQSINDVILLILPELLAEFEVIHHCGRNNLKQVQAEARVVMPKHLEKYYHTFPFLKEHELRETYFSSDIVVSRAGAANIFEIAALGKPSILIPYSLAAQNHQVENAYAYAKNGAAVVMEEVNLKPHFFLEKLKFLISKPKELQKMSKAAKEFAKPRAGEIIADYLLKYLSL